MLNIAKLTEAQGLATVNLNILTAFQQAVLAILIILGNVVFVSTSVVLIRRHFFRQKLGHLVEHSKAGQVVKRDLDEEQGNRSTQSALKEFTDPESADKRLVNTRKATATEKRQTQNNENSDLRQRRQAPRSLTQKINERRGHHQNGNGFFPALWQISGLRKAFHWPFQRLGKQPHEIEHHYFSFEPSIDHKVSPF